MYVKAVHANFEEHWHKMKTLLVAKENWDLLHALSRARAVLASAVENDQSCTAIDRSFVQSTLTALENIVTADDHLPELRRLVWL